MASTEKSGTETVKAKAAHKAAPGGSFVPKRNRIIIVCLLIAAVAALAVGHFAVRRYEAYVTMSLNYDQASDGLTPISTRLNMFEIRTAPVLERVISDHGLEGKTSVGELSERVSVQAASKPDSTDGDVFISTAYRIGFKGYGRTGGNTAGQMLDYLCDAYKNYFISEYAVNKIGTGGLHDVLEFSDEYFMRYELLLLKLNQINRYAEVRVKESGDFADTDLGLSFSGIRERAKDLRDYDLYNLLSFIESNGVSLRPGELSGMMTYRYRLQKAEYDRIMAHYRIDNEGISIYEKAMTAIYMIPTIDEQSRYYMSMTRSAMNDLGEDADVQLSHAMDMLGEMQYTRYIINIAQNAGSNPGSDSTALKRRAGELLDNLVQKTDKLSSDLEMIDKAYLSSLADRYLSFSKPEYPLFDKITPVIAVILVAAAGIVFIASREKKDEGGRES